MTGIAETLHRFEDVVGESHLLTATEVVAPYAVDGQTPVAVAFPASAEEVAALLHLAAEARMSVLARGAGSHLHLGAPPKPIALMLVLTRLSNTVTYDAEDLTVTAQAGMSLEALQRMVGEHGQMLPLDPPGPDSATLGGIVSTNLTGPMRMRYGAPRDLVIGMRVALSTGEIIKTGGRTVKNVAGYDLGKVFVGSLGSAGVILEVTARLTPLPEAEAVLTAALSPQEAAEAGAWLVGSCLEPTACEIVNHAAAQRLRAVLPVTTEPGKQVIVIGLSGEGVTLDRQERDIRAKIANCARLDGTDARAALLRAGGLMRADGNPVVLRASVPISSLPAMMEAASALDGWAVVGRAGDGLTFASPPADREPAAILRGLTSLRARAAALGGHAVLESGPVELKREFAVWGEVANVDLVRQLKQSYDPADTLGCGRFVV